MNYRFNESTISTNYLFQNKPDEDSDPRANLREMTPIDEIDKMLSIDELSGTAPVIDDEHTKSS